MKEYAVIYADKERQGLQSVQFTSAIMDFENLVLTTYRRIQEAGMRHENRVYRQISAGVNAGLIAARGVTALPKEYRNLDNVPVIQQTVNNLPLSHTPSATPVTGCSRKWTTTLLRNTALTRTHGFATRQR